VRLAPWLRGPRGQFARQVLLDPTARGRGYCRPAAVRALLDEHQSARFDHGYRLWSLLVLELWHREWQVS